MTCRIWLCQVLIYIFTPADVLADCVCLSSVSLFEAAGKLAKEEGKQDLGSAPEDNFPDNLSMPPTAAEPVSNPHGGSRSERGPRRDPAAPADAAALSRGNARQPHHTTPIQRITHNEH